jgi:hypothetical protein
MRGDRNHLKQLLIRRGAVNDSPLQSETTGAMAFPFSRQGLVVKTSDQSQTRRAGQHGDVLAFMACQGVFGSAA